MVDLTLPRSKYRGQFHVDVAEHRSPTSLSADVGPLVYAARLKDGTIKIGFTTDIANRMSALGGWKAVLGFVPGTFEDEQDIHRQLRSHRKRGREYYHPTPEVIGVVNDMRARYGFDPIEA